MIGQIIELVQFDGELYCIFPPDHDYNFISPARRYGKLNNSLKTEFCKFLKGRKFQTEFCRNSIFGGIFEI